jgi:DNA-binding MarR family transcriptional regulator
MQQKDIYSQPGYLIRRLHQRSTAEFAAATNGLDVTQIQFSILLAIRDFPGIDATRISELIYSDRTTVRQALLILEKKGLITRAPGAQDRRTKSLVITNQGRSLLTSIAGIVPSLAKAILKGLNERERQVFMRLAAKMIGQEHDTEGTHAGFS